MKAEEFTAYWNSQYSNTLPVSHFFRNDLRERWFRIHSLSDSKRYAENDEDWNILLERQYTIFADLLGENSPVLFVTGEYYWEGEKEMYPLSEVNAVRELDFIALEQIDLYLLEPNEYEPGQVFRPVFTELIWNRNKHNSILKAIAEDELRGFFISIEKKRMVAPYDGGVDLILENSTMRDYYKLKYNNWLSKREDGL